MLIHPDGAEKIAGTSADWLPHVRAFAEHHAKRDGEAQVVWFNATVDCYGRTPLPEWNLMHANRRTLRIVKVVKP